MPERPATIFIGGGTPSLLDDALLARLLAALPACGELTVECNPETITPAKAQVLVEGGVTRVSLGAQSFQPQLLATLERRATPDRVVQAVATLRRAGVTNLNLSLVGPKLKPAPVSVMFDAAQDEFIALEDGTRIFVPAGALWWGPVLGSVAAVAGSFLPAWSARSVRVSEVFAKVA